ncbi:FtsK/SpoIIIE family DNA translocase [Limobrevibacterium gyesilva]|uniref:DNA translocase FtsK n=1 Tax=Limobrevibacterium gyesilva TaxID=2991712 RepID=A0AA41YVG3_9PROT|nr:DNA translocase FtsK [Limobrevibacterium gyesilva]MCW3477263.1 DNA translocase FtsK 4TM domain-containing protein [Limobrevibacterium gyesilva]
MALAAQTRRNASPGLASPQLRTLIRRRLAELGAIMLALAGLTVLVALASYDVHDPSLNTATVAPARNLVGPIGAIAADLLLQGFGVAGMLPGLALLAWAWRIGSHRGLGGLPLRLAALLAAMPVLGGALAGIPGLHGGGVAWPTQAGLGGAGGLLLADDTLSAGRDMLGPFGGLVVWGLGTVLAVVLTLLALGLSAGEWRAAGRAARGSMTHGRSAAGLLGRLAGRIVSAFLSVLHRLNGTHPAKDACEAPEPEAEDDPQPRREPRLAPAPRVAAPAAAPAVAKPKVSPAPKKPAPVRQDSLPLEGAWRFPPLSLLAPAPTRSSIGAPTEEALQANARLLESVLADYGVQGQIVEIRPGPVVTLYELEPAPGIRSARVIGLADDVARSLSVTAVRIATVPGRNVIGIEVPNARRETVYLSELLSSAEWEKHQGHGRLALALGKDISGSPIIADLARMPHLLVAGTTGSGKSVGINAMILSLLYKMSPDQCRLILIDPKMLELSVYEGIPHLMAPVVTEPAKAVVALKWTVREMERRYRAMSQLSVRNIGGYNDRVADARAKGEVVTRRVQTGFDSETGKPIFEDQPLALEPLPFIVVVIDEMADLMMVAGKEIEAAVQRLAQMARAAGIHVVMATQRPSVDVITGTIKANFPTRISFTVISKFDSRTILGEQGAEQLLGQGDMLYMAGGGRILRVHGPFVSDKEVEEIVAFLREQGEPAYLEEVTEAPDEAEASGMSGITGASDSEKSLFDQAVDVVSREGKASTSFIQRHLQIGYNRAARLIEQMEKEGIVGPANHVGKREVLVRRSDD